MIALYSSAAVTAAPPARRRPAGSECCARSKNRARPGRGDQVSIVPGSNGCSSVPCTSSATQAPTSSTTAPIISSALSRGALRHHPSTCRPVSGPKCTSARSASVPAALQHRVGRVGAEQHEHGGRPLAAGRGACWTRAASSSTTALIPSRPTTRDVCPAASSRVRSRSTGSDGLVDQRGQHDVDRARGVARDEPGRGRREHPHRGARFRAEDGEVAARRVGQLDDGRAGLQIDALADRGAPVAGLDADQQLGDAGCAAAVEQPRLARGPRTNLSGILCWTVVADEAGRARVGDAGHLVAVLETGLVVEHGVPARQLQRRLVAVVEHAAGPGQRDAQHELLEDRRTAPERLDAGHVLAGEHEVDALGTAAPRDVLQQRQRRAGDGVALRRTGTGTRRSWRRCGASGRPGRCRGGPPAW